jgi:3-hydroxybutyryl-CoA dehydrogenase
MNEQVVGVIGAGVMGVGVAQNLAQTHHQVILIDLTEEILERARREIAMNIRFHGLFAKDGKEESVGELLERIEFSTDQERLREAVFVIENIPEKWDLKQRAYQQLDAICPENCVFAANTSSIPITRLASVTRRPSMVIGLHFMNPVPMKQTVEMIRGYHTSAETIENTKALLTRMGKTCIIVNDSPGFVSNRVLMLTINEAIFLLQEQVASAEEVDHIFRACFGHKMGPLETADLIGLDTILFSIEALYESFNDGKYRPCPLLKKMVDAGLYGRKSGKGFYTYQ